MSGASSISRVVLLASVLKPVDDPRMRGKLAAALLARGGMHVHVAGRGAAGGQFLNPGPALATAPPAPVSHPIFVGERLSWQRLAAQGRYWRLLRRLRPAVAIVCAPELLPLTLLWQWLGQASGQGRQFIYDVRENYALNVTTQAVYGGWQRRILAAGLRWVEGLAARRAAAVLLAEKSYADELPFLARLPPAQVLVLENKYQPAPAETLPRTARPLPAPHEPLRLLFSGTVSELNGIRDALALAEALHQNRPGGAVLTVIGCCQQPALLAWLLAQAAAHPAWLRLRADAAPVPHARIVAEISAAHFGLLPYRPHPSTWRCRPTKLFEYLAHGLPVLLPHNPLWTDLAGPLQAGLALDFGRPEAAAQTLLAALAGTPGFYPAGPPTDAVLWAAEGKTFGALVNGLLDSLI